MEKEVKETVVAYGSENVFADLGMPLAEEHLKKARIASVICDIIEEKGLTQAQAAELMGIDQPKVSKIVRGRFREFSIERLARFVARLDRRVEIVIQSDDPDADPVRIAIE